MTVRPRDEWRRPSVLGTRDSEIKEEAFPSGLVHSRVRESIGVGVQRAANVLESHAADLVCEQARPGMQRLQSGVLHLVVAEHLLNEQQRVGADQKLRAAVRLRPFQRGEEATVLRDVIGGHANRFVKLLDEGAAGFFDAHAETRRPRVAARAAVNVGD